MHKCRYYSRNWRGSQIILAATRERDVVIGIPVLLVIEWLAYTS